MPLPPLHWKFVGADASLYPTVQGVLDSIYRLGQSTTYVDGSARVPGTGSAWTWVREGADATTTAAVGAPPSVAPYTNDYDLRYVFAGNGSSAPTTILTPDTNAAGQLPGCVWMGMNRGAFTYVGPWTAAQPFGSGFSGYWHGAGSIAARVGVQLYESEEACVVVLVFNNGATAHMLFGALFDPLSASGAEANGRLYYMQTQGYGQILSGGNFSFLTTNTAADGGYGNHNTTANTGSHCGYLNPGLTTVRTASRFEKFVTVGSASVEIDTARFAAGFSSANGDQVKQPFHAQQVGAPASFLGPARSMWVFPGYPNGSVIQNGSTVLGYGVGPTNTYAHASVMLGV